MGFFNLPAFAAFISSINFLFPSVIPLVRDLLCLELNNKNNFSKGHANIAFIKNDKVDPHLLRLFLEDNGFGLYQSSEDRNTEKRIVLNENGVIKFFNIIETKKIYVEWRSFL